MSCLSCRPCHLARDATEIDAREKPQRPPPDTPPDTPSSKRRRGRPRKGEEPPPKPPSRLERQQSQTLEEMCAELPTACDIGLKRNASSLPPRRRAAVTSAWIGYKLHLDTCEAGIPIIDINSRRDKDRKAEILAERANARLKDEFGARNLRVRGHLKASCHLMFGAAALAEDTLIRLLSPTPSDQPPLITLQRGENDTSPKFCKRLYRDSFLAFFDHP